MSKPKLVVTSHFTEPVEDRINREFEALRNATGAAPGAEELIALTMGADAMLVTPNDRLNAEFFNRVSTTVKVIATYSVGLDHIDLHAASAKGIEIAYTPGINADATADIAMLLMLGASRRAYEGQQLLRSGE